MQSSMRSFVVNLILVLLAAVSVRVLEAKSQAAASDVNFDFYVSPAFALGIEPIDLQSVGLLPDHPFKTHAQ